MLRPLAELTTWAEEVSKLRNLATVAPRCRLAGRKRSTG